MRATCLSDTHRESCILQIMVVQCPIQQPMVTHMINRMLVVKRCEMLFKEISNVWSQSFRLIGTEKFAGVREWYQTFRMEWFRLVETRNGMAGMSDGQLVDFCSKLITFSQMLDVLEDVIFTTQCDKNDMACAAEELGSILP